MRVLGVDPGLTRCGVGVVDGTPGRRLTLVRVEVLRTAPDVDLAHRLLALEEGIEAALDATRPDAVAVERVFAQHNVRTVMGTAQAGAIAIAAAARRGVSDRSSRRVTIMPTWALSARPLPVTAAFTSLGVCSATGMPRPADAADALALAICHLWRGDSSARLAAAAAAAPQPRIPRSARPAPGRRVVVGGGAR